MINATPKDPNANAWVTLAEADAQHATRLHNAKWTGATDQVKESAIIWSCRNLNKLVWNGRRTTQEQSQSQPRVNLIDADGYYIDSDLVYKYMKEACIEYAFILIEKDTTKDPAQAGVKKMKVAVLEFEFDKTDIARKIPSSVINMISPWLTNSMTVSVGKG